MLLLFMRNVFKIQCTEDNKRPRCLHHKLNVHQTHPDCLRLEAKWEELL